jgi:heavy metal translocating P-type ATPase
MEQVMTDMTNVMPLTPEVRNSEAGSEHTKPGTPSSWSTFDRGESLVKTKPLLVTIVAFVGIVVHVVAQYVFGSSIPIRNIPLQVVLIAGGGPLVVELVRRIFRRQFGSDLLAGMSIVTSFALGEYLAGAVVVLMLSGGQLMESFAVGRATSALRALARRMPTIAHRRRKTDIEPARVEDIEVGDELVVFPHEICPVDGAVIDGHGWMDEAYLTGEPFRMAKTPGSAVLSGAVNGEHALTIRATKVAIDSRYARIMQVMNATERDAPRLRRIGDALGAYYTPLAVVIATVAWAISGEATRFLAVLVIATPCPLLIAIPVAIVGSVSLCARRGIVVKKPVELEQVGKCETMIFDKTGTLTYGRPRLSEVILTEGADASPDEILSLVASVEQYSKHPLAGATLEAARKAGVRLREVAEVSEPPGSGMTARVDGRQLRITGRRAIESSQPELSAKLPPSRGGLESVVLVDGELAATLRFRDEPRIEGAAFVRHLGARHGFRKLMIVSGDREGEVRYLADTVGISNVYAGRTPEEKLEIVRSETKTARTLYVGDGINDAPALLAATVGVALGQNSDVTTEAAGVVIMDSSLAKVDEFLHIGRRMRRIALQSAVGGIALSVIGMILATSGGLTPVLGAGAQEVIDLLAVANALRVARSPKVLTDF